MDPGRSPPRELSNLQEGIRITVPWAEVDNQVTAWFERLAIDLLQECSMNGAAGGLRFTGDETWASKARAVGRGLSHQPQDSIPHLGVDEKTITKRHRSLTVVADLGGSRVSIWLRIARRRGWAGSGRLMPAYCEENWGDCHGMDMWEPSVQSMRDYVDAAATKVIFDTFPVRYR